MLTFDLSTTVKVEWLPLESPAEYQICCGVSLLSHDTLSAVAGLNVVPVLNRIQFAVSPFVKFGSFADLLTCTRPKEFWFLPLYRVVGELK